MESGTYIGGTCTKAGRTSAKVMFYLAHKYKNVRELSPGTIQNKSKLRPSETTDRAIKCETFLFQNILSERTSNKV